MLFFCSTYYLTQYFFTKPVVYTAERFVLQDTEPQNPWFIIESGFKSRAGYNGAHTVNKFLGHGYSELLLDSEPFLIKKYQQKSTFRVTFFLNSLEFEGLAYLII